MVAYLNLDFNLSNFRSEILFIILSQKHKSVEKIMYDHNNEYRHIRRQETVLKWGLLVFSGLFISLYIVIEFLQLFYTSKLMYVLYISFFVFVAVMTLTLGSVLAYLMREYHRYEYNKHKCNMLATCLLFVLSIIFSLVVQVSKYFQVANLPIATRVDNTIVSMH